LEKIATRQRISTRHAEPVVGELLRRATTYEWPGNVRELENLIERIASFCTQDNAELTCAHLDELVPETAGCASGAPAAVRLADQRADSEMDVIQRVLDECNGNRLAACRKLGIGRTTLWRKLAQSQR
ncbi:MAG: propionate catabolism operon regulatory protein PrpR, partial [Rhodanobacter sp.]